MNGLRKVRVWDLPTRIFHWLLAIAVVGLIVTARIGGNAMEVHFKLGYSVLALLVFRILWGLFGGHWSRFSSFVYSPASLARYLRGGSTSRDMHEVGHSPLGSLSVFGLFLVLAVQVVTGLMADDAIAAAGPLVRFVSPQTSDVLSSWHAGPGQWLIISLAVLHIVAVLFYVIVKRKRLIGAMVVGDKMLPDDVPSSKDSASSRLLAIVALAIGIALATWIASFRV